MKQAAIYLYNRKAGLLTEDETGYTFAMMPTISACPMPKRSVSRCRLRSKSIATRCCSRSLTD